MNTEERRAKSYLVSGRVQGVGYRAFTVRHARALGLEGGTTNLDDGRVLVAAEGPGYALDRLESALWQGPWSARVDGVKSVEIPNAEAEGPFDADF